MNNPYVLPKEVKPIKYTLELTPNFKDLTYKGNVNIELKILKNTKKIILNSNEVKINKAEIKNNNLKNIKYNKKYQTVIFTFNNVIKKGIYNLDLEFNGKIAKTLRGFYKSTYLVNKKEKIMLTTQFEPNDARKAFPCFDEPELKAKFSLKLNIPKNLQAISNMPVKKLSNKGNLKTIIFEETPIMSTYLLAFVISELEYLEGKTKQGTKIRIYSTPGKKYRAKLALDVAIKSLEFFNNYFKIPYPLPKLDLIAIPDFEAGAMENWGLITYRETQLLFDEKDSSVGVKQAVTHTITHEVAHQWFGNLVTMKWWNDLWLNEGFASWIENKATDAIFPEFDIWTQFITDVKIPALYLDSLDSSHPIDVDVRNPNDIDEIFDAISYNKGSAVIRMLEQYLGEEAFRNGLKYYLSKFKYENATTNDLWNSLEKVSKKPVKNLMNLWTKQTGYPIVSATLKDNKISLEQERFFYLKRKDKSLWHIPVAVSENNNLKYYLMKNKNLEINANNLLINNNQVGFYRIKYDNNLFNNIINKNLNIIDKIGMQNDVYALARGSYIKLENYIKLASTFKYETNHALWDDLATSLGKVQLLFDDKRNDVNKFIRDLFSEIFKKLGWDEKPQESHTDILLRANVISTLGYSDHKEILDEASKKFNEHAKGNKINPNLRSVVYGLAAYNGDKNTFNKLKKLYLKETLQEEKVRLLGSLGVFKQKEILEEALKFSLTKHVRSQDALNVIAMIGVNEYADNLAWEFLKKNWKEFYKRYGDGHVMPSLIKAVTLRFKSLDRIKEVKKFFKKHEAPTAKRAIQQILEVIKINYNFVNNNKDLNIDECY
ncbi:MAG: M1 family metallopeptidase [Nanoarchaeota archaeon]